jgi:hypothetical protein
MANVKRKGEGWWHRSFMFDEEGDGGVIVIQAVGCSILFYSLLENNCPFVVQKVRGARRCFSSAQKVGGLDVECLLTCWDRRAQVRFRYYTCIHHVWCT